MSVPNPSASEGGPSPGAAIHLPRVLLINRSAVLREMLRLVLASHADSVITARTVRDGLERIAQHADLALVVCDDVLEDGSGFSLLETIRSLEEPKPRVILVSSTPDPASIGRATALGALGLLAKPICFRDIACLLRGAHGPDAAPRPLRRRSVGRACLLEPDGDRSLGEMSQLCWNLRDISASGAFLETGAPLPVGEVLHLALDVDRSAVRVVGEVVRVQEPSWNGAGGIGVHFVRTPAETVRRLEAHVEEAGPLAW